MVDAEPIELAGRSYDARIAHVRGPRADELGSVVVLRDVSDHTRLQRMLTHLALTDELTGIANRRHLLELTERVLARAARDGQPTAFVIFDLDRFKLVNDQGDRAGIGVSASVWVCAIASGVASDLETVLTRADAAQYEAKRQGGDRVVVLRVAYAGPDGLDAAD